MNVNCLCIIYLLFRRKPETEKIDQIVISNSENSSYEDAEKPDFSAIQRKETGSFTATNDIRKNRNNSSAISKRVPSGIWDNVSFLVSTSAIVNWEMSTVMECESGTNDV